MAVYRLAREHTRAVTLFLAAAEAHGYADLVHQLRDSAASVPANIMEAKGEWRPGKQAHYLMIAKAKRLEKLMDEEELEAARG
ncbi:MAG: four helix bundle protein [Longimicrobiales bacterium]